MPTARIVTRFPERAASLRKTLLNAGYHVEVLRPEEALHGAADIEYDLDEMPEFSGQPEGEPEREFIFAPQWRALKARFGKSRLGKAEAPAVEHPAPKPVEPSVSYARLDEKFVDQPAKGPGLIERMRALRAPLAEKLNTARHDMEQKRRQLAQQMAEHRAAAEEARRGREVELAAKRDADRVAAERARAEAGLRLQEQKVRDAQRLAELKAQMEIRRKEEEVARAAAQERAQAEAERTRLEAEKRARLEAELLRAQAVVRETTPPLNAPAVSLPVERRRSFGEVISLAAQKFRDWRETYPSNLFANTRSYAFRQYAPAAAGIALAFFLGWAIAVGGARSTPASTPNAQAAAPATVPAAVTAPATSKKPSAAASRKATATKQKPTVRRFRRHAEEPEVVWKNEDNGGDDVTVIHHYPGKSNLAHSGKKTGGVKSISDLEQD